MEEIIHKILKVFGVNREIQKVRIEKKLLILSSFLIKSDECVINVVCLIKINRNSGIECD